MTIRLPYDIVLLVDLNPWLMDRPDWLHLLLPFTHFRFREDLVDRMKQLSFVEVGDV